MIGLFECRLKAMNRDDEDADIVEKDMKQDEEDYTYLLIERRRKRLSRRNSEESKNEVSCRSRSVETRVMQITSAAKTSTAAESVPISSNEQNRQLRSKSELSESVKNLRSFENRSKIKESEEEKEDRIKAKTENRQSTPRYNTLSSGISLSCNKLVKCESESDLKRNSIGRLQKESIDLSIGSIRDSPKWQIIKQKFEKQSSESEDDVSSKYLSPQASRRRKCSQISHHSSSLSNLSHLSFSTRRSISPMSFQADDLLYKHRMSTISQRWSKYDSQLLNLRKSTLNESSQTHRASVLRKESELKSLNNKNTSAIESKYTVKEERSLSSQFKSKDKTVNDKTSEEQNIPQKTAINSKIKVSEENEKPLSVKERVLSLERNIGSLDDLHKKSSNSPSNLRKKRSLSNASDNVFPSRSNSVPVPHPRRNNSSFKNESHNQRKSFDNESNRSQNNLLKNHSFHKRDQNVVDSSLSKHPLPHPRRSVHSSNNLDNSMRRYSSENNELIASGDSGHLTEENIYEPLWSYRACDSPGGMNKALKRFSDSDDLSLNSDDNSLYSDSSSYSSGNYDTTVGKISGFLTCPPPLPPRRLSSGNKKTNNNYCNIATLGPIDSKSCSIGEELSNICNKMNIGGEDEDHIYQSIYEHIQNTEELLKNEKMPKMEHEEMLKKLIKELQTLVENAKQAKSLFQSNDVYKSNSCDTLLLEEGKSDADVKTIPKSLSIDGSSKTVLESNESAKTDASSSRPQSEIEFDESDYANLPTSKNNHYANFAPPVEKAASSKKNSLIESIIDSTSGDLKKFLVSRHSSAYSTTSSASEAYITANTAEGQKRVNVNSLEEESNIYPFANTKVITLKKFSETERYIDFDDTVKSPLDDQPLYQFYDKHVKRQQALMIYADSSSTDVDDFFDDDDDRLYGSVYTKTSEQKNAAGKHLSVMDIVDGGIRKLWCEVPQVKEQGLLEKLTPQQRKQQEAMFEVITSEASYLKSLTILVKHFVNNPEFQNPEVIDARKKKDLFSNIDEIYDISKRLMEDLEKIWQHNIIISDVCETLHRYASSHFDPYVNYCKYQMNQERILKEMQEKPKFAEALKRLEANACCQGLTILSFILLPMQRITRYPLLVDAILTRLSSDSPNLEICKKTLLQLNKVVKDCNAAARQYERWHELSEVERKLRFMNIKKFPLASASRFLLKKGEVTRIKPEFQSSILIGSMSKSPYWSKSQNYLFLFNDLLVITKKKSDDYFNVYDYCDRNLVQILPINNGIIEGSPVTLNHKPPENFKYLAQITFLRNHCGKNFEYYFNFSSDNERLRWIEAIEPPKSDNPNEKIYEEWDCPQVLCEKRYVAQQPDELTIEEADVINVFRKSANDWYEGEKISDGSRGWFPACHTVEIANKHVRARNLRIRHRLLVLTESMLEKQFKK